MATDNCTNKQNKKESCIYNVLRCNIDSIKKRHRTRSKYGTIEFERVYDWVLLKSEHEGGDGIELLKDLKQVMEELKMKSTKGEETEIALSKTTDELIKIKACLKDTKQDLDLVQKICAIERERYRHKCTCNK